MYQRIARSKMSQHQSCAIVPLVYSWSDSDPTVKALSICSWLMATSWSRELAGFWLVVTVVLTVYSDRPFWLEVSRMELLFGFVPLSAVVVEAVPARLCADCAAEEPRAYEIPASMSAYYSGRGESALGAGLSRSTSSLSTKGSRYYLLRFVVVLRSCSVLRLLDRPNLLKPVNPKDLLLFVAVWLIKFELCNDLVCCDFVPTLSHSCRC